ncbi:MAG: TolC family protein [Candidatus Zixiibacteriota bacterium]
MKKVSLFLVIVIALMGVSSLAKTYTLDECIEMAKRTDPNLERFRNAVKTANWGVRDAAGQFLPSVGLSYNSRESTAGPESPRLRTFTYFDPGINDFVTSTENVADTVGYKIKGYSAGFNINYTVFDGLNNLWSYLQSKATKSAANYDYALGNSDLELAIKANYYLVLKSKRDFEVAKETVARSEELLKLFEEKYELGSASLSEVLKQRVQLGQDKLTQIRSRRNLEVAFDILAVSIGIDPVSQFDVAEIQLSQVNLDDVGTLIEEARKEHPKLLSSKNYLDVSKYAVRSVMGQYLPRATLSYSYGWGKDHFSDLMKFGPLDHSGSLSFTISYNLFDGFSREYSVSRAKANYNNARAQFEFAKNEIVRQIDDAFLEIKIADETLLVTKETEESASEDMDLVQMKYNLGAAALWELLDAQVSLKTAQFNKVKAEFDYNLSIAKLQNAMGK